MTLTDNQKQLCLTFGVYFCDTGGNDLVELLEREGITPFNNSVVYAMQSTCGAQLQLLERLQEQGIIIK